MSTSRVVHTGGSGMCLIRVQAEELLQLMLPVFVLLAQELRPFCLEISHLLPALISIFSLPFEFFTLTRV